MITPHRVRRGGAAWRFEDGDLRPGIRPTEWRWYARSMTGRWDTPGVPHKGWVDLGVHDEEEPNHICEMCQQAHVRFVHLMRHANYPVDLGSDACALRK